MADVANKYPQNVSGRFYVDDQCIDCDLCRETAPANFTRESFIYGKPDLLIPDPKKEPEEFRSAQGKIEDHKANIRAAKNDQ